MLYQDTLQLAEHSQGANENINNAMKAVPETMKHARSQSDLTIPVSNGRPALVSGKVFFCGNINLWPLNEK